MGRGFLSGIFWGGIVGLVAIFMSSQTLERQVLSFPKPQATELEVPGGSEFNQARPESDPVVPGTDTRPEGDSVAGVAVPDDAGTEPPSFDTAAREVPVPETTQDAPESLGDAPDEVSDVVEPEADADAARPTETAEELVAPETPGTAPEAATAEVEAPEPAPVEEQRAPLIIIHDAPVTDGDTDVAALPDTDDAPEVPPSDTAPQISGLTDAPAEPTSPSESEAPALPWLDRLRDAQIDQAPDAPQLPAVNEEPSLPPAGAATPEAPVVVEAEPAPEPEPQSASAEEDAVAQAVEEALTGDEGAPEPAVSATDTAGADDGNSLLQPVETLTERQTDSEVGRGSLPVVRRLGDSSAGIAEDDVVDDATTEAVPDGEAGAETAEGDTPATDGPALARYATAFEATDDVPLLSIVLVHKGDAALAETLMLALPETVGFAIDASLPDASRIAEAYRAAGREVIMIPALPIGATPQDIEQALAANFALIPEAVAVMDVSGSSFQGDRAAVEQVVDVVAASGHGVITFPRGLNPAHQAAQRAGVPTGLIFRNLDGGSETQEQIRRTLDRAAFRARQDAAVILVGTTEATTLSALTEWFLGNRATTVDIAPVSVALTGS